MGIEIFKTNVQQKKEAQMLVQLLAGYFPAHKINFDLSDCDRILRVEGEQVVPHRIIELLNAYHYQCMVLE